MFRPTFEASEVGLRRENDRVVVRLALLAHVKEVELQLGLVLLDVPVDPHVEMPERNAIHVDVRAQVTFVSVFGGAGVVRADRCVDDAADQQSWNRIRLEPQRGIFCLLLSRLSRVVPLKSPAE